VADRAAPEVRLDGRDLYTELRLAPWEAASQLGRGDTPGGEVKVKVPPDVEGRRIRLRGRGLPNPRGKPGDLFAEARIMVPPRLSARNAGCSSSWPPSPPSIRGGSSELRHGPRPPG